jgi:hypothetical protein
VYRNRRRIRGPRGLRLLRLRGERLERPFAHLFETGGMRRVHLRGHTNILKRLLIHVSGFNLGLLMRQLIGVGTPRGLQGRLSGSESCRLPVSRVDMEIDIPIGSSFPCDVCGTAFTYKGRCVESLHAFTGDGFVSFCTRGCMYQCFATGGKLRDGRIILTLWGLTPIEHLREIFRRHATDPDGSVLRKAETRWNAARGHTA